MRAAPAAGALALPLATAVGVAALLAAAPAVAPFATGPLTHHMGVHVVLMNLVAPALALAWERRGDDAGPAHGATLAAATASQVAAVWLVHAPLVLALAAMSPALHLALQAGLLAVALWFWRAVLAQRGAMRWRAIAALLVTGKLLCLLGVLLLFAPRPLYAQLPGSAPSEGLLALLACPPGLASADQQAAGLLMLIACPLTYVLGGVIIAARWLGALATERARAP